MSFARAISSRYRPRMVSTDAAGSTCQASAVPSGPGSTKSNDSPFSTHRNQ